MFRIDTPTNVPALPAPQAAGAPGFFAQYGAGTQGTEVSPDWCNQVQEELISILVAGGVAPVKGANNQVLAALRALFGGGAGTYLPLAGGNMTGAMTVLAAANGTAQPVPINQADGRYIAQLGGTMFGPLLVQAASQAYSAVQWAETLGGYGASVANIAGSRGLGTVYTNTTGRPIFVSVVGGSGGAGNNLSLFINGVLVAEIGEAGLGAATTVCGVVPAGATYEATGPIYGAIESWVEI